MLLKKFTFILYLSLGCSFAYAQQPKTADAGELLLKLKKLNFLGSVLYVAAHPDDENTRLIAYLANGRLANTAYLSLTRGDGGQNLVGPEIREALGVIRTQELLAARRIDGGQQFFSRANDFGYSKSTAETQEIWDRDKILGDVVWVYRNFRPDVIITRFPPDARAGHGHHTTSAIFAQEAFDLAGDETQYPEQLKYVYPWRPTRLYTNTGRWWNPNINKETEGILSVDVGGYNPLLGASYNELAARSRSQHKSQGFGATGVRGQQYEFLEPVKGNVATDNMFYGIDTTWSRVEGGTPIGGMIDDIIEGFNPLDPAASIPALLKVRDAITLLNDEHWKRIKLRAVDEIIKDALGLYLETVAQVYMISPGEELPVTVEVINRTSIPAKLEMIRYGHLTDSITNLNLEANRKYSFKTSLTIPESWTYSQPYWLEESGTLGTYKVDDPLLIGTAENRPPIEVSYMLDVLGNKLTYSSPVVYKYNDPVKGEQYRPLSITPAVLVNMHRPVYIFSDNSEKEITVTVKAGKDNATGQVSLDLPKGWTGKPESFPFTLIHKDDEESFTFNIQPPKGQDTGEVRAIVTSNGRQYDRGLTNLQYDHIYPQIILPKARSRIVKLNIKKAGKYIGYIQGAGDEIPAALREIGYHVREMNEDEVALSNLQGLDAVILGVRALNTNERLPFYMDDLLEYVKAGGTLIVQYNTSFRLKTNDFAPYPMKLSRDRVTDEHAPVKILAPNHPVMNHPNKITADDFEGWTQERGLYFPNEWDEKYAAILSSHDAGEPARDGGLLVAQYGKGYYVYSGYSWFRELPAGVAGAYRIFVNMVSLGDTTPQDGNNTPLKAEK